MTILPLNPTENATPEALTGFFSRCRDAARASGCAQLVSITVAVEALDPLAVLESIYEPGELHFYAENPRMETAIAGADAVASLETSGPGRFAEVQAFIDRTLEHTLAVGEVAAPFGGPHFFTTFAFHDSVTPGEPFPAARVFVPRWQVARAGEITTAVANVMVEPESDPVALTGRVWRAHRKFAAFEYPAASAADQGSMRDGCASSPNTGEAQRPETACPASTREVGDYREAVRRGLELIAAGEVRKIVLARAKEVVTENRIHPLRLLNDLRQRFPDCHAFSIGDGRGRSFIGASPERLVRVSRGNLETEALAGSIRRGVGASEDAALGASLLRSEKDLREHALVLDSMARRLAPLGMKVDTGLRPGLKKLANVQHLCTPVRVPMPAGCRLLDVVAVLHPTPAVGGTPRERAVARIAEIESMPRGLYAGAMGWVNARGGGEFVVGIRSALVDGRTARVFAGAGIVAGSVPDQEFTETELKFRALEDALKRSGDS
ncbi:MAG: isochorismate synthase [Opitutaceae bacterium]|nr:isochorismate synthase [Opitutaceae bacterium]